MEEKPNYFAVLPASVRYNEKLNSSQKIFFSEITALTQKTGECWASNNYFARLYKVSPSSISNWVKMLEKEDLITVEYKKNGREIEKRIIKIKGIQNIDYVFNKLDGGIQNIEEGYSKNLKENNTSINNTSINNKRKYIKEKFGTYKRITLTKEEYKRLIEDFGEELVNKKIELLDEYVESNNNKNKYSNFNLVIRKAIRENWFEKTKKKEDIIPNWFNKNLNQEEKRKEDNLNDEQRKLINQILGKDK